MSSTKGNAIDLKFVVVGDGAVGKTCLLQAFSKGDVSKDHVPTIFENSQKEYTHKNQKYNLDLWDTAGQENFDRLRPLSYKGVDCFLLCFDVSNATSLDNVRFKWIDEVNKAIKESDPNDAKGKLMLVGTKCDMRGKKKSEKTKDLKEVTNEQIRKQREQIGRLINESNWEDKVPYVETSAWERIRIDEVFQAAITLCMDTPTPKTKGCCTIL